MQNIIIYDSEGNEYGTQQIGTGDQRIQDFFFGGLKLAVDLSGTPEVVCFFRARESDTGRSEQFYAVYETGSERNLFPNFKNDLERAIDQYGLTLVTDTDDTQFYQKLDQDAGPLPGDDIQRTVIAEGSGRGQSMRVGVGSTQDAFSLAKSYLTERDIKSIAIADQTTGSVFDNYDLSIEIGQYRGLEPLGDTPSYLDEVRDSIEGQLVSDRIDSIKEEIRTLRNKTSLSGDDIQTRLKQELSVLDPPAYEMATNDSRSTGSSGWKTKIGAIASVVVVLLAVVGGAGLYFGYLSFGGSGDDATSAKINSVSINDTPVNLNDTSDPVQVEVNVTGEESVPLEINYTASSINVSIDGADWSDSGNESGSNFSTKIPASALDQENNTLRIEADNVDEKITIINVASSSPNETEPVSLSVSAPSANSSIQNSSFNVSGTTNAENVTVAFRNNGSISNGSTKVVQVTNNETFSVEYTLSEDISPGTYDIIVNATRTSEFNSTTITNVTVNPQDDTTGGSNRLHSLPPHSTHMVVRASS